MTLRLALLALSPLFAQIPPDRIATDHLRTHVEFLASDLLEGRATPSRGLDIAAEYIAAQFRLMGVKPAAGDSYFQTQMLVERTPDRAGFRCVVRDGDREIDLSGGDIDISPAVELKNEPAVVLKSSELSKEKVAGKVVLVADVAMPPQVLRARLAQWGPKLAIINATAPNQRNGRRAPVPIVYARFESMTSPRVTASVRAATESKGVPVRNVAAWIEGRDPKLKQSFVLVTAHYDHLGLAATGDDRVFNGANDNASSVAAILEIARAFTGMKRPKRSVLFIAFQGEESGLVGSRYYVANPLRPLKQTVAMVNLEQVGRVDAVDGKNLDQVNLTGFDFSDLKLWFSKMSAKTGVKLVKNEKFSDQFFLASDNAPFAQAGVVAHTASVTYAFPDYHRVGDEAGKIDYANMTKVVRLLGSGVYAVANDKRAPRWDVNNKANEPYRTSGGTLP